MSGVLHFDTSPGTGKTATVVEAIRRALAGGPGNRILACAPSNEAVDVIAERLMDLGPQALFRLVAPTRSPSLIPRSLQRFTYKDHRGAFSVPSLADLNRYLVVVSTCASASILFGVGVSRGHFTHIFVDEAGCCVEPEVSSPCNYDSRQIIR